MLELKWRASSRIGWNRYNSVVAGYRLKGKSSRVDDGTFSLDNGKFRFQFSSTRGISAKIHKNTDFKRLQKFHIIIVNWKRKVIHWMRRTSGRMILRLDTPQSFDVSDHPWAAIEPRTKASTSLWIEPTKLYRHDIQMIARVGPNVWIRTGDMEHICAMQVWDWRTGVTILLGKLDKNLVWTLALD